MSDSFFYSQVNKEGIYSEFLERIEQFAIENLEQIYVINAPLGEKKYNYSYKSALALLIPKYKIIFLNFKEDNEEFVEYTEDFLEDLGYISDKYKYKGVLGRPRQWREEFFETKNYKDVKNTDFRSFIEEYKLPTKESERKGEFIISLLTGSINDIEQIGGEVPDFLLDKVKKKIVLFDGDQTRFIYQELFQKRITIQGLAGTGKTELLLHKLKELYVKEPDSKIVFTCHNHVLAKSMGTRIPDFFNFMKVEEQIKWNERLWSIPSWGSKNTKDSGLYTYICNFYRISFQGFSYNTTFSDICKKALDELGEINDFVPCFDYILIDESQDFPESFFKLCEKVTNKTVYIAGDIFQNVFEKEIISEVKPNFLLNKCYRTDPKTLMFAHGVGMGLFEEKLRWLTDEEWEACGYVIKKDINRYYLSRNSLRRFEELETSGIESIKLITANNEEYADKVIVIIEKIIEENPTVKPDDIGVIFLENIDRNYKLASKLKFLISQKIGWNVNIGYESKTKIKETIFISNKNNVKGLEFPFIICIAQQHLSRDLQQRNSLYMMLTRSFLTSYFIISTSNEEIIDKLKIGIQNINKNNCLSVTIPTDKERQTLRNTIITQSNPIKSHFELVEQIMDEVGVKKEFREKLHKIVETISEGGFDRDRVHEIVIANYALFD